MDDHDRVDVRGHGRVVEEHVVGVRVLVGAGRGIVSERQGEGQQSPLARPVGIVDQHPAEPDVEPLELRQDPVGADGLGPKGDGQGDDQRRPMVLGCKITDAGHRPVGEAVDELLVFLTVHGHCSTRTIKTARLSDSRSGVGDQSSSLILPGLDGVGGGQRGQLDAGGGGHQLADAAAVDRPVDSGLARTSSIPARTRADTVR